MKRRVALVICFLAIQVRDVRGADLPSLPALPKLPPLPSLPAATSGAMLSSLGPSKSAQSDIQPSVPAPRVSSPVSVSMPVNALDTTMGGNDDARGSWFKKRHWLLKGREQQEKINSLVGDIQDVGGSLYDAKRASFDRDVNAFYEKNSVGRGQIDVLLDQLAPFFNKPTQSGAAASDKDLSRLSSSKRFKDYYDNTVLFAQLKADLQGIVDVESGVTDRVNQFEKCSQQALEKSAEAQKIVNEMFAMVNHDKARDSYYKLEGIAEYLDAVLKFVKGDLSSDLDKIIAMGRSKMDDVGKTLVTIRTACDSIKKSTTEPDEGESGQPASLPTESADAHKVSDEHDADLEVQPRSHSWISGLVDFVVGIFQTVIDLVKILTGTY